MTMKDRWEYLPDECKCEIFNLVYCHIENGYDEIGDDILEDVCRLRPELPAEVLTKIENGKIYRGDVKEGRCPKQSTSWTASLKVAEWFSNRFARHNSVVWCGKIDPGNIVAYITKRDEDEIVVKRGTVTDILQVP